MAKKQQLQLICPKSRACLRPDPPSAFCRHLPRAQPRTPSARGYPRRRVRAGESPSDARPVPAAPHAAPRAPRTLRPGALLVLCRRPALLRGAVALTWGRHGTGALTRTRPTPRVPSMPTLPPPPHGLLTPSRRHGAVAQPGRGCPARRAGSGSCRGSSRQP